MSNFHFNAFPSGTKGALFSIESTTGEPLEPSISIITEACELDLKLNLAGELNSGTCEQEQKLFFSRKCSTCNLYKGDLEYYSDLVLLDPKKWDKPVEKVLAAVEKVRESEGLCGGGVKYKYSAETKCPAGHIIELINANKSVAQVYIPELLLNKVYKKDGITADSVSDLFQALSGVREYGDWRLYRYWEEKDKPTGPLVKAFRLTNVYGDAKICWGENNNQHESFKAAFTTFWASRSNFDLQDGDRVHNGSLKSALETYICKEEGRSPVRFIHKPGKTLGKLGSVKGFVITDAPSFLKVVPEELLLKIRLRDGYKYLFFGWVMSLRPGKIVIDCRNTLIEATELSADAVLTVRKGLVLKDPSTDSVVKPQSVLNTIKQETPTTLAVTTNETPLVNARVNTLGDQSLNQLTVADSILHYTSGTVTTTNSYTVHTTNDNAF